jgi:hypothetical protein
MTPEGQWRGSQIEPHPTSAVVDASQVGRLSFSFVRNLMGGSGEPSQDL